MLNRLLGWLNRKKDAAPLPDALWQQTVSTLPFLDRLDADAKQGLRRLTEAFLAEKEFTCAGGLQLTDAMCVSIAAQGCLPILNLGLGYYRDWVGIIVYPDEFVIPRTLEDEFGVVHEYDEVASGEAWEGGPLLISWSDAQMAGDGYNVVIHEFAHKLDMLNGEVDGIPPLPAGMSTQVWETILLAAYEDFCMEVDIAEANDEETVLDPYAAENPGEFFAVMSETFFETPERLLEAYPALYEQFTRFYRQTPITTPCPDSSAPSDQMPA
ncbi:zinc-dependent peptidase [Propionivibrio dicarboxylicus]|uniref:Mlc titration factor A n=1 Tax=Propionivibrio dicarboxylicus TaxID=83767 RepID=A0A1G8LV88_9RHOO|nr:M90 family metallopeptidase [Propionivibrio dicarboxylicus]SDI59090.1 hypothetical protein SAMN05660652_03710 [Propionivibrio dicarboxylicus]